jgi:hypothetical protein
MPNSVLEGQISFWQMLAFIGAIAVAGGIFLEVVVFFDKKAPLWQRILRIIFAVMVCAGIGLECLSDKKIGSIADDLQIQSDKQVGAATQRAAEAEKQTEDERSARVQLEAKLAWRELDESHSSNLSAALSSAGKPSVDIFVCGGSPETENLSRQIRDSIRGAHWPVVTWSVLCTNDFIDNVVVITRVGSDAKTEAAADLFVRSLKSQGVMAMRGGEPSSGHFAQNETSPTEFPPPAPKMVTEFAEGENWDRNKSAPIRIFIGDKWQPSADLMGK